MVASGWPAFITHTAATVAQTQAAIDAAYKEATSGGDQPTMIVAKTKKGAGYTTAVLS